MQELLLKGFDNKEIISRLQNIPTDTGLIQVLEEKFMEIKSLKTHKILSKESILEIIKHYVTMMHERSILVITSKILSLCQNRVVNKHQVLDKFELVKEEADLYLEGDYSERYGICLTIKNGILIPTAGIDESNSNGNYILYPLNLQEEATQIWNFLRIHYQINEVGVLITDSHTTPLRRGVTGIALGWCGFQPLHNYIGKPDIFGNLLRVTQTNILDGLASSAVFVMGEGSEQTPLALISSVGSNVVFQQEPPSKEEVESISISLEDDLYAPLLKTANWKTKKKQLSIDCTVT